MYVRRAYGGAERVRSLWLRTHRVSLPVLSPAGARICMPWLAANQRNGDPYSLVLDTVRTSTYVLVEFFFCRGWCSLLVPLYTSTRTTATQLGRGSMNARRRLFSSAATTGGGGAAAATPPTSLARYKLARTMNSYAVAMMFITPLPARHLA